MKIAASFLVTSWAYAGRAKSPAIRISVAIEHAFFIA